MKDQNEYQEQGGQYTGTQDPDNDGQKIFLPKCMSKKVPIGIEFHQSQIPQLVTLEELQKNSNSIIQSLKSPQYCQTFMASNISPEQIQEYLEFVQEFYLQKDPDIFSQGLVSKEKIFPKALELLHKCEYNLIKAKFNITFPYFSMFNRLRPESAIELTQEQMETKMRKHKEGLRRTREKDQQKWIEEVALRIENKVDLHTISNLIESGKQNKYDIPQNVRELIDKATRFGKQLKKMTSQNNKVYIDKLLEKRQQLQEQKIITNEMNVFQSTVSRCVQWTKKAQQFNQQNFMLVMTPEGPMKRLKMNQQQKIQFKLLSNLVDQYISLPLVDDDFESIKVLYDDTIAILDKLPQFAKSVKTRNQNVVKMNMQDLAELEELIDQHPIRCDEFDFFLYQAYEHYQHFEKIIMLLDDKRTQKTSKQLIMCLKQTQDIPIIHPVMKRLERQIEYLSLMEKIRKDILVFSKFQQTQENIRLIYSKGYSTRELKACQAKLDVFKNWFHTTQKFNSNIVYSKVDIVKKQNQIISNMIDQVSFQNQLMKAKEDLKIQQSEIQMYYQKLQLIKQRKKVITQLLQSKAPNLRELTLQTLICVSQGLKYPQFLSLFVLTRRLLIDIADLSYLLNHHGFLDQDDLPNMFFTTDEHQEIVGFIPGHKKQLKELTKTQMEMVLQETTIKAFPHDCIQCNLFKKFVESCTEQQEKAARLIASYNRLESFQGHSERLFAEIEELLKELKGMLVNESLIRQLNQVLEILKCKRVIDTKISLQMKDVFTPQNIQFIQRINQKLNGIKEVVPKQKFKALSLRFQSQNKLNFINVLTQIINVVFQKPLKLSEIFRIQKQIDKIELDSIQLRSMKKELSTRYHNCEEWRAKMLEVKNKKKPKKQEKQEKDEKDKPIIQKENQGDKKQQEQVVEMEIEEQQNAIKSEQNDYFYYYFKFPLLIIKFYEGLKLKTNLEQLSRLRLFISQITGFLNKFDILEKNPKPLALEISDLNSQGNKWGAVFLLEKWKISRRNQFVMLWRNMAISILESMPILRLQQRTILLIPDQPPHKQSIINEELLIQQQHPHNEAEVVGKQITEAVPNQAALGTKRKRKLNTFYNNEDITLLVEDLLPSKLKKKKKAQEAPPKRKSESKKSKKVEVIEYIEHLESVYCICRFGLMNESSIMLQCEVCERWFHTQCVGIRKSYIKTIVAYFCPGCCKRYDVNPDYYRSFYWQSSRKMSEDNFRYLVNEGHQMSVTLEQLSPLLTLEGRIDMWKSEVEKTVRTILEAEAKGRVTQPQTQKTLFDLYLESLWLPTVHVETDILLTLLKKHDTPQRVTDVRRQALAHLGSKVELK